MGEARRRKKLDSSYGKVPSLKTLGAREKHFGQFVENLSSECKSEMRTLLAAKKMPDDYEQIRGRVASWIENRILKYSESEREKIANFVLVFFTEISEKNDSSVLILLCLMEILAPYLSLELSEKLADSMEDIYSQIKDGKIEK